MPYPFCPRPLTAAEYPSRPLAIKNKIAEIVFTAIFLFVILGATHKNALSDFAGIAIGLALFLIHIVVIPITGTSVNPARSIGPALFAGGEALSQLWLFIVAPIVGGILGAAIWKGLFGKE